MAFTETVILPLPKFTGNVPTRGKTLIFGSAPKLYRMSSTGLAFPDEHEGRFWVLTDRVVPLEMSELAQKIVEILDERGEGLSATQLHDELHVTPSAIIKVASQLVEAGLLRKEELRGARNVKLYVLSVKLLDVDQLKELKDKLPPSLLQIFTQRFRGNENLAIAFTSQINEYLKGIPAEDRPALMNRVLREITQHEKN